MRKQIGEKEDEISNKLLALSIHDLEMAKARKCDRSGCNIQESHQHSSLYVETETAGFTIIKMISQYISRIFPTLMSGANAFNTVFYFGHGVTMASGGKYMSPLS